MTRRIGSGLVLSLVLMGMAGSAYHSSHIATAARWSSLAAVSRQVRPSLAVGVAESSCPVPASGIQYQAAAIPGGGKTVALTFDDGPGASTAAILSILKSFGVRATFFNIGVQETEWPQDVRAEAADGFLIGNHTWDHPNMTTLSAAGQAAEMDKVIDEQQSLVGSSPCVFRPPYGDYNSTTLSLARQRHMAVWLWDVDTQDWMAEGSSSVYWVNRIISLAESEGGALSHPVVLMHNQGIPMPATVAALPTIIRFFRSHGYTFVDLLGRTGPPSPGYWLVTARGNVYAFGDAGWRGSEARKVLPAPVVGMASTPDGAGYWLVTARGKVYAFGDAAYYGSETGKVLPAPVVGMASTPDGAGYWLVTARGNVYAFGDAGWRGSEARKVLPAP
ncbi:MAG: polysaccharide deacetylase family protein, partial [Acidimicrobiales bacterium]